MAQVYFDHNVSRKVGLLLEWREHNIVAARDISAERLTNDAQLLLAVQAQRVLVTHNHADFRMLHDAWVTWPVAFGMSLPPHPGILVLDAAPPTAVASVLEAFFSETPSELLANAIFWWQRREGWRQPIAGARWEPYRPPGDRDEE